MASWVRSKAGNIRELPFIAHENLTPEQKLWKAVLSQAVYEACTNWYQGVPLTITEKYQAQSWIDLKNKDFLEVCEKAGYDPEYIVYKAKKLKERKTEIMQKVQQHRQSYKVAKTFATIIGTIR